MAIKIASLYAEIGSDTTKLESGLGRAKTGLKDAKKASEGIGSTLKTSFTQASIAIGAFTAAAGVAAAAFEGLMNLGKEGAELEYTARKFDRLAAAAGTTSDVLMYQLKGATKGLVSDAELVASAGDFMALGLAKTSDEVVRLTTVAGGLGMDMNQLVLTLANQTTMRFDQLGVSVDGFDDKVKKLKATGMDANAAFKEAFLQQAEEQLKKVGAKADSGAAAFLRMDAATKNLGDSFKKTLAPSLVGVAEGLTEVLDRATRMRELKAMGFDNFDAAQILEAEQAYKKLGTAQKIAMTDNEIAVRKSAAAMKEQKVSVEDMTQAIIDQENALAGTIPAVDEWANTWKRNVEDTKKYLEGEMSNIKTIAGGAFGKEDEQFSEKAGEIREEIGKTLVKIEALRTAEVFGDEQKADLDAEISKLGDLEGELSVLKQKHEETMKTMAFNMLIERAASDGLTQNETDNMAKIAVAWGLWDEKTAAVVGSVNQNMGLLDTKNPKTLLDILDKIMNLPSQKNITVTTYFNEKGKPPSWGGDVDLNAGDYATGTDFIVPPGYPNDSYRFRGNLTSGERVQITPASEVASKAASNVTYNIFTRDNPGTIKNGITLSRLMGGAA